MEQAVAIGYGNVRTCGHGFVAASFRLSFVGMLEKETNHLDTHQLLHFVIVLVLQYERVVFDASLSAAYGTLHPNILLELLLAVEREECGFFEKPIVAELM